MTVLTAASAAASSTKGAVVHIATYTVNTTGNNGFSFTNIPQIYSDLYIEGSFRTDGASTIANTFMAFDNCSLSSLWLNSDGGGVGLGRTAADQCALYLGYNPAGLSTSGMFNSWEIYILDYAKTNKWKTFLARSSADINGSGVTSLHVTNSPSNRAVDYVDFSTFNGSAFYAPGTTVSLYGIRKAGQ
jgi:hypothetical protein